MKSVTPLPPSAIGLTLLAVSVLACIGLKAQESTYLGALDSNDNSRLNTLIEWDPEGVPTGADWKTDNTLRELRFTQTRIQQDFSFANYSHETTDSVTNPHFEWVNSSSGDWEMSFDSISLASGAIPLQLTNNTGEIDVIISGNFTVNSEVRLGRPTVASTSPVSSIGMISVGGVTTVNAGGLIRFSRTLQTVNLGSLELAGGTLDLTTGSGSNGSSTSVENTITVNRLNGASGTIQANKASTSGQLIVDGGVDGTFDGTIIDGAGSVRLTKDGSSTLTLTGANTYSGSTSVLDGTLALSSTGSIASSSDFAVSAGATLSRDGDLSLPDAVSIGIDGSGGQIIADTLTLAGDLSIPVIGSYSNDQWLIFDFDSVLGSFDSVSLTGSYVGSLVLDDSIWSATIDGRDWTLDQSSGMLTVIPEPGTLAFALGLAAIGIAAVTRRWK